MAFLTSNTPLDVVKHLVFIAVAGLLLVLGFFYVYLPVSTHHGNEHEVLHHIERGIGGEESHLGVTLVL